MADFKISGTFKLGTDLHARARNEFRAYRVSDDETLAMIREFYDEAGEVIDPHTAVGVKAARLAELPEGQAIISLACAHPAKFPEAVEKASGQHPKLPLSLAGLLDLPERYQVLANDYAEVRDYILQKSS